MILMRFWLRLLKQNFSYRFVTSQISLSGILHKLIPILITRLPFLFIWPIREELWKTFPDSVRESFPKYYVFNDCFDVFIGNPSDLTTAVQIYSFYKSYNSSKVLIGMTPQGKIPYISKPWNGRISNVFLSYRNVDLVI